MKKSITKSYKYRLKPNTNQEVLFQKYADANRFVYNWGLEKIKEAFEAKEKIPSYFKLTNLLTVEKKKLN